MLQTLAEIDEADAVCERLSADAPDGRKWQNRRRRVRRRLLAACVLEMPANPAGEGQRWAWEERARRRCGMAITTIIAAAVLSWLIQRICDWLYERWQEQHTDQAGWAALRSEACVLIQQEGDE